MTVLEVPVPFIVLPSFTLVSVHVPTDGSPFNTTLPVGVAQSGCVIVPTAGADGVAGCGFMIAFADDTETQPEALVTVNVYVPEAIPEIVVLVPDPFVVAPPDDLVIVHVPETGRPESSTLPFETVQVG